LPFYEFRSKERMDDKKWLQILDSPKRPAVPEWLKEIYSGNKLSKPKLKPIE
jgi:hypothetical protein